VLIRIAATRLEPSILQRPLRGSLNVERNGATELRDLPTVERVAEREIEHTAVGSRDREWPARQNRVSIVRAKNTRESRQRMPPIAILSLNGQRQFIGRNRSGSWFGMKVPLYLCLIDSKFVQLIKFIQIDRG
jgi:hypothetical protein